MVGEAALWLAVATAADELEDDDETELREDESARRSLSLIRARGTHDLLALLLAPLALVILLLEPEEVMVVIWEATETAWPAMGARAVAFVKPREMHWLTKAAWMVIWCRGKRTRVGEGEGRGHGQPSATPRRRRAERTIVLHEGHLSTRASFVRNDARSAVPCPSRYRISNIPAAIPSPFHRTHESRRASSCHRRTSPPSPHPPDPSPRTAQQSWRCPRTQPGSSSSQQQ